MGCFGDNRVAHEAQVLEREAEDDLEGLGLVDAVVGDVQRCERGDARELLNVRSGYERVADEEERLEARETGKVRKAAQKVVGKVEVCEVLQVAESAGEGVRVAGEKSWMRSGERGRTHGETELTQLRFP